MAKARSKVETANAGDNRAPFNREFFATVFRERITSLCRNRSGDVAVVLLQLGDGQELDLCHIEILTARWMTVAVFRDAKSCEDMDFVFVPYEMITRVTLSKRDAAERRVGFQIGHAPPFASSRNAASGACGLQSAGSQR
ncbi:MAG TPA: hypothetical protein VNO22_06665 [Planctomycetota bacterium]|nr:hypothetical protein [Planctomycetota bacterium]